MADADYKAPYGKGKGLEESMAHLCGDNRLAGRPSFRGLQGGGSDMSPSRLSGITPLIERFRSEKPLFEASDIPFDMEAQGMSTPFW